MIPICLTESGLRHAFNRIRLIEFTGATIHPRDGRPPSYEHEMRRKSVTALWGSVNSSNSLAAFEQAITSAR